MRCCISPCPPASGIQPAAYMVFRSIKPSMTRSSFATLVVSFPRRTLTWTFSRVPFGLASKTRRTIAGRPVALSSSEKTTAPPLAVPWTLTLFLGAAFSGFRIRSSRIFRRTHARPAATDRPSAAAKNSGDRAAARAHAPALASAVTEGQSSSGAISASAGLSALANGSAVAQSVLAMICTGPSSHGSPRRANSVTSNCAPPPRSPHRVRATSAAAFSALTKKRGAASRW
mmetsp:Transcript_34117/g.104823  ORF Transcript_34117/g.104823 Transcript_34117/m.104823 type:complete len:230 (+) Transcript_34117:177-866(+)